MKIILFLLLPIIGRSQTIQLVDTVEVDGYFYQVRGRGELTFKPGNGLMDPELYFVSMAQLKKAPLSQIIANTLEERDTVKFVAGPAQPIFGFNYKDSAIRKAVAAGIRLAVIDDGQKGSPSGYEQYSIFASYVRVKWLHLKIDAQTAQDYEFNRPTTFDHSVDRQAKMFDYYLPIQVLDIKKGAIVKEGRLKVP